MLNGKMRFGAIESFAQSEDKERGDKYEGALEVANGQFSKIEYDHPKLGKFTFNPVPNTVGTFIVFTDEPYYSYSLYALNSNCFKEKDNHKIDKRMIEFGDYALVINEPNIFLERVKEKLTNLNLISSYKLIEYKDYKEVGTIINTNLFSKTKDLQHQFEHRILIKTEKKVNEIFIEIGSIENFCFLSKTEEILQAEFTARRKKTEK